jgi:hypothetical protein
MSMFKKIKKFYKRSSENETQTHMLLGFIVIPVIVLLLLYFGMLVFWPLKH